MDFQTLLAIFSDGVVGVVLGATGGGGALIAIPLLVYVVGVPVQNATVMSLMVVGYSALFGAWKKSQRNHVRVKAALVFSATGAIGAWIGAQGHAVVAEETILVLFGLLMLGISGWSLYRSQSSRHEAEENGCAQQFSLTCVSKALSIGFGVGLLTGFFGIGGGFLIVPALMIVLDFPGLLAVGTSLMIISLTSIGGIIGHLEMVTIEKGLTALVVAGSFAGILVGHTLSEKLGEQQFSKAFGIVVGCIGGFMVIENLIH